MNAAILDLVGFLTQHATPMTMKWLLSDLKREGVENTPEGQFARDLYMHLRRHWTTTEWVEVDTNPEGD